MAVLAKEKDIMNFEELKIFLKEKMKLSHLYQPLLIKELIDNGGKATIRQLAISFLKNDESQIQYFEKRIREMPLKVLSKHGIIERKNDLVELLSDSLTFVQKIEIQKICDEKIFEFVSEKGMGVWDYRYLDDEYIPDSLRYRLLKEAKGICALCGSTKEMRPLDIDHILPRSKGGKTVYENLQVLCSKCNRSKNNKDDEDFRALNNKMKIENCTYCYCKDKVLVENEYAILIENNESDSKYNSLIIPKRHVEDFIEITKVELSAIHDLLKIRKKEIIENDKSVNGFIFESRMTVNNDNHCSFNLIPERIK